MNKRLLFLIAFCVCVTARDDQKIDLTFVSKSASSSARLLPEASSSPSTLTTKESSDSLPSSSSSSSSSTFVPLHVLVLLIVLGAALPVAAIAGVSVFGERDANGNTWLDRSIMYNCPCFLPKNKSPMSSGAPVRTGLTIRRRGGKGKKRGTEAAARVVSPLYAAAQLGGGMTAKEYIAQRRGSSAASSAAAGAGTGAAKRVIGGKEVHGVLKETNPLNVVEIVIETAGAGTRLGAIGSEREHALDYESKLEERRDSKQQALNQVRGGGGGAGGGGHGGRPPLHNTGPYLPQTSQVSASSSFQDAGPLHISVSSSFSISDDEDKVSFGPRKVSHRVAGASDVAHPPPGGSGSIPITPILTQIVPATPPQMSSSELSLQDLSNNGGGMDRAARAHFIGGRSPTGTSGNNSYSSTSQLEASVFSGIDSDQTGDKVYFEPMHITQHHVQGYAPYNPASYQDQQQQQQYHHQQQHQPQPDQYQQQYEEYTQAAAARDRVKSFS